MFYNRDWSLSENEDLRRNILPKLGKYDEAVPVYSESGVIFGWIVRSRYE